MPNRECFHNMSFFEALVPRLISADTNGLDIDLRGYEAATVIVQVGSVTQAPAVGSHWVIRLQHTDASALGAGPSDYADVVASEVVGINLSNITSLTSGIWKSLSAAANMNKTYQIGYKGSKRYLRVVIEKVSTNSDTNFGAVALRCEPSEWPAQADATTV